MEELLGGKQVDAIKPGGSTFKAAKRVSEKVRLGEMQQSFFDKPVEDLDDGELEQVGTDADVSEEE